MIVRSSLIRFIYYKVDLAARCGRVDVGERLLKKVENEGTYISVETKTALLKVSFGDLFRKRTHTNL